MRPWPRPQLRRSAAGLPPEVIQAQLGHATLASTRAYLARPRGREGSGIGSGGARPTSDGWSSGGAKEGPAQLRARYVDHMGRENKERSVSRAQGSLTAAGDLNDVPGA
jgi:hypothetical protein